MFIEDEMLTDSGFRENVATTWERQEDGAWQVRDYVYVRTEDEA